MTHLDLATLHCRFWPEEVQIDVIIDGKAIRGAIVRAAIEDEVEATTLDDIGLKRAVTERADKLAALLEKIYRGGRIDPDGLIRIKVEDIANGSMRPIF